MRILVATGLYPPEIGGPATHTALMEKHLPQYGIEVDVLPFRDVRYFPRGVRHAVYFWNLLWYVRGADILFAQDTVSVGLPAALASFFTRVPLVVRVPGDYAWEQARQRFGVREGIDEFQTRRYGWRVELLRWIQRRVVQLAQCVITPSEYFKNLVSGWGVSPEKLHTVYNGISLDVESAPPDKKPEGNVIISVGRLVPWKGFGVLIEMLKEMLDWHLVIIGDGPFEETLKKRAENAKVIDRVTFTGSLPREQVFGWLKAADAFVLNSSFESFSFQVAEAMAAGVPIVATNIGSIPELITHKKEGMLVTPDDTDALKSAIESVLNESAVWSARMQAAHEKARQFSVDTTMKQLAERIKLCAS